MSDFTSETARKYINNFKKNYPQFKDMNYVMFPSGGIDFDLMTDEQAIKVANGLLDIEAEAHKDVTQ